MDSNSSIDVPMLSWLDLSVFSGMLAISSIIGCYFGCRPSHKTSNVSIDDEYLRGGHSMNVLPVALSLVASFISGITMLGLPSEIYRYGTQYWIVTITVQFVCLTIASLFVPLYADLNLNSCYQYLEMRFDPRIRKMTSFLFVLSQLAYIPVVIYVSALAFSQVTGLNVHIITSITSFVCIFYTTLGGLRAVVWTDTLQVLLMVCAQIAVLILGIAKLEGGLPQVWHRADVGNRLEFFNLNPDPTQRTSAWTMLIGLYFQFLAECGVGQGFVQRYLSVPNLKAAKRTLFWFAMGLILVPMFCISTGLLMYATYYDCDPLTSGRISQPDQLLPLYVLDVAGNVPGLSGLFIAGVFSAALSSMSTGINALSGVVVEDLLPSLPKILSKGTWLRISAALAGAICVCLVLLVEKLGGVIQTAYSLSGITSGTMLGLFTLGMLVPRANTVGALAGSATSLVVTGALVMAVQTAIANGHIKHPTLAVSVEQCPGNFSLVTPEPALEEAVEVWWPLRISFMYYTVIGVALVWLVGVPTSYLIGNPNPCRRELITPIARDFLAPLPNTKQQQREVKPLFIKKI